MAFDFNKLASSGAIGDIVEPSTLFDALPNKAAGYGYLRAVQKTVLDAWSQRQVIHRLPRWCTSVAGIFRDRRRAV